jgi:hypothetical protein
MVYLVSRKLERRDFSRFWGGLVAYDEEGYHYILELRGPPLPS